MVDWSSIYYNFDEFNLIIHECQFCRTEKLCAKWLDMEDMYNYMCEDCMKKLQNKFNNQKEKENDQSKKI